ncbi:MAG: sensor histidine kinase [Akkermansiaceae bacterium]|nr:sensor histidine kinase [Akkermansiaceae bacterium]
MLDFRAVLLACLVSLNATGSELITDLATLRSLPSADAAKGIAVKIEGTVVGLEPSAPFHFFLNDGKAGCFIKTHPSGRPEQLAPGDHVRVEGLSDPLGFYPSVREGRVTILGKRPLPQPVKPIAGELFAPELDSQWVEVPAVVTGYELADERITLALEVHGLPFKAELPVSPDSEARAAELMQRPVMIQGVMGTIFNRQRQMTDRHFFVPSFAAIIPTTPLEGAHDHPLLTVSLLLTGLYGPSSPVRLQGVVTQLDPKGFYLRDESGSTLIQAAKVDHIPPGSKVEAEGFGAVAPFRPVLRASRVTLLSSGSPQAPLPFDFQTSDLSAHHAEWVTLDADFLGQRDGPIDGILQFRSGGQFFEALQPNQGRAALPALTTGDRVRLTGICELTTTHALPRIDWVDGFRIHLPETGGLFIISHAPWWNTRRLLFALGIMSGIAVLGFLGTGLLRRQVKRQMQIISDKLRSEAVGEERDRMARELHDTLEQQLSGIALQLDSLDHAYTRNPVAASATLTLARRMLRYTRHDARRSVWDLRSKVLERDGLPAALSAIPETSGSPVGPSIEVHVSGEKRVMPPGVDFHLLRIAQEATTNAIKHGGGTSIRIELSYQPEHTSLTITDDGAGFDSSTVQTLAGQHFGLLGMRERAGKIGASLVIKSAPGAGCAVTVLLSNEKSS